MNDLVSFIMYEPIVCGPIGFRLANETMSTIILITTEGMIQAKSVTDAVWLGSHTVKFEYYLAQIDPDGIHAMSL